MVLWLILFLLTLNTIELTSWFGATTTGTFGELYVTILAFGATDAIPGLGMTHGDTHGGITLETVCTGKADPTGGADRRAI